MAPRMVWVAVIAVVVAGAMGVVSSSPASAAGVGGHGSSPRVVAVPVDYCGTPDVDVPDQGFYFNFGPSCAAHDACYTTGGTEADRLACDVAFLISMQNSCNVLWPVAGFWDISDIRSRRICYSYAQLYFTGVRIGGGLYFNYTPI